MSLILFVPAGSKTTAATRYGLGTSRQTAADPVGGPGRYYSRGDAPAPTAATHQAPVPLDGDPGVLVYVPKDTAGLPALLAHQTQLPGYVVPMAGGFWTVPVVRYASGETPLPKRYVLRDGHWILGEVEATHADLFRRAGELFDQLLGTADGKTAASLELEFAPSLTLCADALALNYRLDAALCSALGLFQTDTIPQCLRAVLDLHVLEAIAAELRDEAPGKPSPSAASGPGQTDDSRTIAPASGNSAPMPSARPEPVGA